MPRAPRAVSIQSLKNQAVIADKCLVAVSFLARLRGLIGRSGLEEGEGMYFPRCNDIHMWFMRFPIDVVFLRRTRGEEGAERFTVTSVRESVRPWRVLPVADFSASETLELPAGTVRRCSIQAGDELCLS